MSGEEADEIEAHATPFGFASLLAAAKRHPTPLARRPAPAVAVVLEEVGT
jgi:hypothetical protein